MKNIMILRLSALVLGSAAILSSCIKSDRDKDNGTYSSLDNALAFSVWDDIFTQVDDAAKNEDGIKSGNDVMACATIESVDTISNPKSIVIDFGPTNCQGIDTRNRRGKIRATFTGRYKDKGTIIKVTPIDFYVNDYKVEGSKTITNKGTNANGKLEYLIEVKDGVITFPDGNRTTSWESTRTHVWNKGDNTLTVLDDEYLISGTASGTNRFGNTYTMTTTSDLDVKIGCPWIRGGILEIQPQNLSKRIVDFGNGTCDDDAKVTINGKSYDINMN